VLLSLFSGRSGATEQTAIDGYYRLTQAEDTARRRRGLARAIAEMRAAGLLIGARDDTSRYNAGIVADYLTHRPFPPEITARMIRDAGIGPASRVLDLAGGPGDLAVQLAHVAGDVSLMELSRGFLVAASNRAKQQGVRLHAVHDSCNRLVYRDDSFDVVTVSQALHWLDDVMVCRGLCRVLRPGGSFFVVHGVMDVGDAHPLAYLFGRQSILGAKPDLSFSDEVAALLRRLSLLFEALDTPDVERIDPARRSGPAPRIRPSNVSIFRQYRPLGAGFARALLTPTHIAATGSTPDAFWAEVEARTAAATPEQLAGRCDWALLQFHRTGTC